MLDKVKLAYIGNHRGYAESSHLLVILQLLSPPPKKNPGVLLVLLDVHTEPSA